MGAWHTLLWKSLELGENLPTDWGLWYCYQWMKGKKRYYKTELYVTFCSFFFLLKGLCAVYSRLPHLWGRYSLSPEVECWGNFSYGWFTGGEDIYMSSIQAITSRVKKEGQAIRNIEMHKTGRTKGCEKNIVWGNLTCWKQIWLGNICWCLMLQRGYRGLMMDPSQTYKTTLLVVWSTLP